MRLLAALTLELFRPLQPMLAQSAPEVASAVVKLGVADGAVVEVKLEGHVFRCIVAAKCGLCRR